MSESTRPTSAVVHVELLAVDRIEQCGSLGSEAAALADNLAHLVEVDRANVAEGFHLLNVLADNLNAGVGKGLNTRGDLIVDDLGAVLLGRGRLRGLGLLGLGERVDAELGRARSAQPGAGARRVFLGVRRLPSAINPEHKLQVTFPRPSLRAYSQQ